MRRVPATVLALGAALTLGLPATPAAAWGGPAGPISWRPAPTAPGPGGPASVTDGPATLLALVNQQRRQAGCPPLAADPRLDRLAQALSDDMAARGYFAHTDPAGRTPWDRARAASVDYLGGENIARGQPSAQAVTEAWLASSDHRANMLNCRFTELGSGLHQGPGGPWWTEDFGYPPAR
ncbi:CAP domain-containing protein [Kitasatospora sp. NPDC052896]|uniref:CAP domain-containing protein n=1 Tax=Kitasatospora sp. NPDC052896 TaxID=3364061 RepID=UPI0037CB9293